MKIIDLQGFVDILGQKAKYFLTEKHPWIEPAAFPDTELSGAAAPPFGMAVTT